MKKILNIYYDLKVAPITFDAGIFFCTAVALGLHNSFNFFKINIIADAYRNRTPREKSYSIEIREWRLLNIIHRLATLLPGENQITIIRDSSFKVEEPKIPFKYDKSLNIIPPYSIKNLNICKQRGIDPQILSARSFALDWARKRIGNRAIILTLRRATFDQIRDCNFDDWFFLYEKLVAKGYKCYVIPDQDDVLSNRQYLNYDWDVISEASIDLELRLALYQCAAANISWQGGQQSLMYLSKSKFLTFGAYNESSKVANLEFLTKQGTSIGRQHDFFLLGQEFDWLESSRINKNYLVSRAEQYLEKYIN